MVRPIPITLVHGKWFPTNNLWVGKSLYTNCNLGLMHTGSSMIKRREVDRQTERQLNLMDCQPSFCTKHLKKAVAEMLCTMYLCMPQHCSSDLAVSHYTDCDC